MTRAVFKKVKAAATQSGAIIVISAYLAFSATAQEKQRNYDWNFGLGLTSGIVPSSEKTMKPVWLSYEIGFAFGKDTQHQLSFDGSGIGGGKKEKIG